MVDELDVRGAVLLVRGEEVVVDRCPAGPTARRGGR